MVSANATTSLIVFIRAFTHSRIRAFFFAHPVRVPVAYEQQHLIGRQAGGPDSGRAAEGRQQRPPEHGLHAEDQERAHKNSQRG
jgi:hypothetical protein